MLTTFGPPAARIISLGGYRPDRVVTNAEIARHCDTSDQWIRERTGIATRCFAAETETVVDMAVEATEKALAAAGLPAADVDLVLVATSTHPYQTPGAAAEVATRIGAPGVGSADLSVGCAGFSYGVAMAADAVRAGSARHVVVIGSEKLTDFLDLTDRATSFIFGDGAGAAIIGPADEPGIGPVAWGSDGSRPRAISQEPSWAQAKADPTGAWPAVRMDGPAVFRWAVTALAPVARRACELAGVEVAAIDVFVPHQANLRIIEGIARSLRLADAVVARDVVDTGNTSAASVPLALSRLIEQGEARSGDLALLLGFGAGLAYAGQVVTVP